MSTIQISNLTFSYEDSYDVIFDDVSLQIDTKWKLGFCGRNGRGKTTFLKILMGRLEYNGQIRSEVSFDYFPFSIQDEELSVLEVLGVLVPLVKEWEIRKELSLLAVDSGILYQSFCTLSYGEKTKILLAGLFLKENNFLLIDEPTNHLDVHARRLVATYLKGKSGFILVSHDRAFLDACTDHTLSLNKTEVEVVKGNFSSWWEQKRRKDAFEVAQNEKLGRAVKQLQKTAEQSANWSDKIEASKNKTAHSGGNGGIGMVDKGFVGAQSARMMKRSKQAEKRANKALDEKKALFQNLEKKEDLKMYPLHFHAQKYVRLENINLCFQNRTLFEELNMTVEHERLALVGGNGSGKSSILKLISGEMLPTTGTVKIGNGFVISYVPQDASFLKGSLDDFANKAQIDLTLFKSLLRKLDFSRKQFEKDISSYSAGQKKKVLLARSLSDKAHLYIWDEPLNYIDMLSRMQIEELLLKYQPAMIFVEHDATFVRNVATRVVEL